MNKKLFLGMFAAAGMLLATSCSNDELDMVQSGNEAQVTFSLGLEGGIATRAAISDGTGAKKLVYAVYKLDADGTPVLQNVVGSNNDGQFVDTEAFDGGLTETVSVTLAKGQTYQVAFWAQNPNCSAYTTTDLTNVEVSYNQATNNNDVRDAFFKTVKFTVSGNQTIDVELKRPFAQINVGVYKTDWEAAVKSGIEIEKSSVVIKNAATSINLLTGEVGDETTDVEVSYLSNTIPNEDLKVDLNGDKDYDDENEKYKWLSMSYILVADRNTDSGNGVLGDETDALESLQYTFTPKSGNAITFGNGLNNVPVQRNWRTNILGQILTGDIQFNITINPIYEGDINVDAPVSVVVSTATDFEEALADPNVGEIVLTEDITLDGGLTFGAAASTYSVRSASTTLAGRDIVIDGNGATITFESAPSGRLIDVRKEAVGVNFTLKNVTLLNNVSWVERGINYNTNGTLTLDNVTVKSADNCSMNYAVNLPANSANATIIIKDSNIGATANALNLWGEKTTVNVTNSDLYIIDNNEIESYAVIALNSDGNNAAEYSVVTVTGGSVKVTGSYPGESCAVRNSTVNGKVEISATTEVVGDIREFIAIVYYEGQNNFYSFSTLQGALDKAANDGTSAGVRMIRSINECAVNTTAPYGNYYGVKHDGVVLDGDGNTLDFELGELKNGKADNYGIMTSGGTIKNMTITGVFRGIMIMNPTQDLYIDNVTIGDKDVCYAINTGEGDGTHSLNVSNSTIKGWSSYGTAIKNLTFTNCTFAQGEYYTDVFGRLVKPYVNTLFDGCEFNSKFYIDLSAFEGEKITLKNCTINGVKLTADNWKTLIVSEDDCADGQISIELKDGSYLTADNVVDYVVFE